MWTWGGKFFGYIDDELLFTYTGICAAKLVDGDLYDRSGSYLGEVMSEDRLIVNGSKKGQIGSIAPLVRSAAIAPFIDYVGYVMYVGYSDFPSPKSF